MFGMVEQVIMVPQQSYSFVTFTNINDAKKAMDSINGRKLDSTLELGKTGVIFYLYYLIQVPDEVIKTTHSRPPGLVLVENFITEEEEKKLLDKFSLDDEEDASQTENDSEIVQKQLKHRKVKHFGYEFLYGTNNIDTSKPLPGGIPEVCHGILQHMLTEGYIQEIPDQLTVNQYNPGQGIPPHIDTHSAFEDGIVSLSLGAKITMEFRHPDQRHVSVLLPQRSLLVMTGESRYEWTHGITPRRYDIINENQRKHGKQRRPSDGEDNDLVSAGVTQYERETRISLTFRKIKQTPCKCNFPKQCDSQNYNSSPDSNSYTLPATQHDAQRLEATHVHEVYEKIAEHFSDTRHSPWPKIASFLRDLPMGSLVADVGCGNGKYLGINDNIFKMGSDRSFNLTSIAKERGHSIIVCDILQLPYRSKVFDVCMCIAVLHHLSTTERRLEGLRELVRIVRPGGLVLVYVWALEQNLEKIKKNELKELEFSEAKQQGASNNNAAVPSSSHLFDSRIESKTCDESSSKTRNVQVNLKREVFEQQDLFVPWKYRGDKQDKRCKNPEESNNTSDPALTGSNVYHRFYHVFKEGELLELCSRLDDVVVRELYYDRGNWCVLLETKDEK
ncbi:Alkylated DNA repair protein alkB-like 8 [Exaiptasia diaphana]|nr:Alkylated DNA repair protein alkB-like 8 [Exaiptasia diaphana]